MKPLVSVIIPVYRVEHYLAQCIESVQNQTYDPIEIILVDDGSPDQCGKLCDDFGAEDPRITVIHKPNGGLSSARNAGLAICKGEYIAFVDSDDWVSPVFIEALVCAARKYDADIAAMDMPAEFWDGEPNPPLAASLSDITMEAAEKDKALGDLLYQRMPTGAQFKLYKRSIFRQLQFPVGWLYEDLATTYRALLAAERVAYVRGKLYAYRKRMDSILRQPFHDGKMVILPISRQLVAEISRQAPHLQRAAAARVFAMLFSVYLQVPARDLPHRLALWQELKHYRLTVLTDPDPRLRLKNRLGALASFLGMDIAHFLGCRVARKKGFG